MPTSPGIDHFALNVTDLDRAQVRAVRVGERLRVHGGLGQQHEVGAGRQVVRCEGGERDILNGPGRVRIAAHREAAAAELQVAGADLEQVRGDLGIALGSAGVGRDEFGIDVQEVHGVPAPGIPRIGIEERV